MNLDFQAIPGQCYANAIELAAMNRNHNLTIVHGIVHQANTDGNRIVHAWVEDDINCYDMEGEHFKTVPCPKTIYYKMGNISVAETRRYPAVEAFILALDKGHMGPWDDTLMEHAINEVGSVYEKGET